MTECGKCGDCCEQFYLKNGAKTALLNEQIETDCVDGQISKLLNEQIETDCVDGQISNHEWVKHVHLIKRSKGSSLFSCDLFDSVNRVCTIHETRPQVCRGFPWYDSSPGSNPLTLQIYPRCTFWADLPEDERPVNWQPVTIRS